MSQIMRTKIPEVPVPYALMGGGMVMALSAYYMTTRSKTGILGNLAAAINLVCLINVSLGVNIVLGAIYLAVRPFGASAVRRLNSNVAEAMWADAMSCILPPSKIVVSGVMPDDETQAIIVANHQVDSDWWFLWELMRRLKRHGALKIILKDDQKHIPITGWGMRAFGFIFLKRDWSKDRVNLIRQLDVFRRDAFPLRLLIFPEGTTVNQRSMSKSVAFAKKEQRPTFEHLLLPRSTGFCACVEAFASAQDEEDEVTGNAAGAARTGSGAFGPRLVYDVTIGYTGYTGEIPTWEMGFTRERDVDIPNCSALLRGRCSGPVHLHIEKHLVSDIQDDGQSWLDATWARKDILMKEFMEMQRFPHDPVAVFESPKSPLLFLLLSALPAIMGWLTYAGVMDLMGILAGRAAAAGSAVAEATSDSP